MDAQINKISFVVPVYNEEDNIVPLTEEISKVAERLGYPWEAVYVDDCSSDRSLERIKALASENEQIRYVSFVANRGQSMALSAGFQHASGDVIVTLDADLQNDPADLVQMFQYYGKFDVVNGWRHNRKDSLSKKLASRIGNGVRNLMTNETIRDTGCSLKILNAAMVKRIKIFKGLHRFLPTLMRLEGASVIEVKVNHRARIHGESKYTNLRRGIEGFYDLVAVRWMIKRHLTFEVRETNVNS
jgi:glycosyltransferase involved in cell wall biosynthesis